MKLSDAIRIVRTACYFSPVAYPCIMYNLFNNNVRIKWCGGQKLMPYISITSRYQSGNEIRDKLLNFDDLPGPRSYPVIGTLYKYLPLIGGYDAEALDKNAWINWRRYGELVRETPGVRLLHVFDPDDIEAVFRQDDRYPARRSHIAMYNYRLNKKHIYNTGGLLSTNITLREAVLFGTSPVGQLQYSDGRGDPVMPYLSWKTKNGADWWRLRSSFQKNFTSPQSVMEHVQSTDTIVMKFVQWVQENKISHDEDFLPYLNRLNLEVIGKVAFDEKFNSFSQSEQDPDSRSSKTISAAFDSNCGIMKLDKGFLWKIFTTPLYAKLANSQDYLEKVSQEILINKMSIFDNNDIEYGGSLLQSFLKQPDIDIKDIVGMMVDILMASIDTTAYSTSFALYHLARSPESQQNMFQEITSLLPTKDSLITTEIVKKAIYVRNCVKESLRLNPVSIGVGRLLQKDIVLREYLIPKGTVIVTQNMIASRLPQYVKDPLLFKPERWMRGSPEYENIHPFMSLPFGFGPRSCIARRLAEQNITIFLIRLIQHYNIKWMGKTLGVRTLLINKPDKPVLLAFDPRR